MKLLAALPIFALAIVVRVQSAEVEYHIWTDPKPEASNGDFSKISFFEENLTFGDIMNKARDTNDPRYQFKAVDSDFGRYFPEIGGVPEDTQNSTYWMLYRTCDFSPNNPPTDDKLTEFGADGTPVKDGDCFLWWRKPVHWASP